MESGTTFHRPRNQYKLRLQYTTLIYTPQNVFNNMCDKSIGANPNTTESHGSTRFAAHIFQ